MKTVLIIDDDPEILETFAYALSEEGLRVLTAPNAEDGITLARQHLPDLILTDIDLPGADGRSVLRRLRGDRELGAVQIVLMTGNSAIVTPRAGMELGADDFLLKPIEYETLVNCVRARLRRARIHWRVEDQVVAGLRANLSSTLPHEFFTPLAGILGLLQILRGSGDEVSVAERNELLDEMERSGWRLHRTLRNYLHIVEPDSCGTCESEHTAMVDVHALQPVLKSVMERHGRQADLVAEIAGGSAIRATSGLLMIVEELVENACTFSRVGSPVEVRWSADGCLRVSDHGRGMTPDQIQRIGAFQQFDRKVFEQQGLGLGLALVLKQARRLSAQVSIESQPGEGTTVQVVFAKSVEPASENRADTQSRAG